MRLRRGRTTTFFGGGGVRRGRALLISLVGTSGRAGGGPGRRRREKFQTGYWREGFVAGRVEKLIGGAPSSLRRMIAKG